MRKLQLSIGFAKEDETFVKIFSRECLVESLEAVTFEVNEQNILKIGPNNRLEVHFCNYFKTKSYSNYLFGLLDDNASYSE